MRIAQAQRSLASHLLVFLIGASVATATLAWAVPGAESRATLARYQTLDSFAQALSHISKGHVDIVDERKLIYGAIVGMVGELDAHSSRLDLGATREIGRLPQLSSRDVVHPEARVDALSKSGRNAAAEVTAGRASNNDVLLPHVSISKLHADRG